jgi:L-threonylcarbamoyladenylate synthase
VTEASVAPLYDARRAEDVVAVAQVLREGGVAVVPTDTVYGLGASALQPEAVERVFTVKRRAPELAVPVLISTAADALLLAREIPRVAWTLIDRFWPGPLTLVLPARTRLPRVVTGGGETVGVRVPAGRSILALLESVGEPLIGTSANRHGSPSLTTAAAALAELGTEVDAVLADDSLGGGLPSTVVEITETQVLIHRAGAITPELIREAVGLRVSIGH